VAGRSSRKLAKPRKGLLSKKRRKGSNTKNEIFEEYDGGRPEDGHCQNDQLSCYREDLDKGKVKTVKDTVSKRTLKYRRDGGI